MWVATRVSRSDQQVQQFEEAAAVVLGPAGLRGSNTAHGAAGADQALYLQVQIVVLGLSYRDRCIAVQRHPTTPLAGISEVLVSATCCAAGVSSRPFSYGRLAFPAMRTVRGAAPAALKNRPFVGRRHIHHHQHHERDHRRPPSRRSPARWR